jgi:hypothetical protein
VPNDPGGPSYDNTPSDPWKRLDELMQRVRNIEITLDDGRQHAIFNDGTMRSFVDHLEHVKQTLASCAPPQYVDLMVECLRLACDQLNLAADDYQHTSEYEHKRRRTPAFYNHKNSALKKLKEVLKIWDGTQRGR